MIHELLLNLWHHPGNIGFADDRDWTHLFELPQFLHPGEKNLLQTILEIGIEYHRIVAFTNEVLNQTFTPKDKSQETKDDMDDNQPQLYVAPKGFYLKAFCNGIQDVLKDYREEIVNLEAKFLEYPQLNLTYIFYSINKYKNLFNVLKSMISKIQTEYLHGCLLLNGLHKYLHYGDSQIVETAEIIIKTINVVFYQHLSNWVVCGDLVDPYDEFFICDGKVADDHFLYPEQCFGDVSATFYKKSRIKRPPPVRKFYINWNMVPSFIKEDTAESILFMGRIVWIVRNDPKKEDSMGDYQTKLRRDIWEGKEFEYYNKVLGLANESFNTVKFLKSIEDCRVKLTKYLWSITLEEGHLIQHLKLIREYYGLGRGELFQEFLAVSDKNLREVSSGAFMQHINFLFYETARKIYGENDRSYMKFELSGSGGEISKRNPWQKLQLHFEIEWPLHIVFHPEVMQCYNKLFSFLLRLKKTQINLFKLWKEHTFSKHKIDRRVWTLRHTLMFLVNNLQYYMQVNVIESQFSTLLKAVESANEFEDIIKIHHDFVTNLLSKTFVLSPDEPQESQSKHKLYKIPALQQNLPSKVYNVITELLSLCDEFCLIAGTWEAELTEPNLEQLEDFQKKSNNAVESLLTVLYTMYRKISGGHLLQLLLLLDFNGYFSESKADLNLTEFFS
ncbi:gamma-tubulin complex component 4 isoform X2 [Anthonomus grandis grandis]|uniref:gamma-tubulin complex component 4 isoform X2 n=1 Tax=Anthonomus grandis grandis TaxID=2921223 RepID=UPI0021664EF9|nr:gamma-tubulin complex component 4 isoform X2 [Anthonomus grandis grandis]